MAIITDPESDLTFKLAYAGGYPFLMSFF